MIFLWFFYDFTMSEKNGKFSDMILFMIFLWLNLWFFYDEIYDLVSLGFEEKSGNTQKFNHKKLIKKS